MKTNYKEINGIHFHIQTNDNVCHILSSSFKTQNHIKLYYGDTETGRDWHEQYNTIGTIGRSCGGIKIPLLIHNSRSTGGIAISDHRIIKIKDIETGKILYQAHNYIQSKIEISPSDIDGYTHNVLIDGEIYGRCKSLRSAKLFVSKLM